MNAGSPCLAAPVALLALLAGCSGNPIAPAPADQPLSPSTLAAVALDSDLLLEDVMQDELGGMASNASPSIVTTDVSFSRTRPCPVGGRLRVEASMHRTFDPATAVMEARFSGSRFREDCAFQRDGHVLTVNSSTRFDALRRRIDGAFDGPQVTTYAGSLHVVRDDGEERFCEFDLTIVRDPDAGTRTVGGTMCGRAVSRSVPWNPGG